ncbi:MAG TPA: histidine kinase dimerization/phospho-acceptor domain-containing protein [Variovorax sp.]|nr:histidine kinase dimerization/phospho-acceptor domain-containing protein [Variovorax sp.]
MSTLPPRPPGDVGAGPIRIACDPSLVTFLRQFDHDLRTPLGTMTSAVELLRDEPLHSDAHAASIAVLERQIARMHALTQTLREFSRRLDPGRDDIPRDA